MPLYDGAYYYESAARWTPGPGTLERSWSPLYVVFYRLLQIALPTSDPFLVYAFHRAVILFGVVVLFWLLVSRHFSWELALPLSLLVACDETLLGNFQVVHSAGLLFALAILWWATRKGTANRFQLVGLLGCAYFVRPEFSLVLVLAVAVTLLEVAKGRIDKADLRPGWLGVGCLVVCGLLWWGSRAPRGEDRLFTAFSQQGAWSRLGTKSIAAGFQYRELARELYGDATTVLSAMRSNPNEFSLHVARNLQSVPTAFFGVVELRSAMPIVSALLFPLAFGLGLVLGRRLVWPGGGFWIPAAGFLLCSLGSSLIIRPALPYWLAALPCMLVAPALLIHRRTPIFTIASRSRRGFLLGLLAVTLTGVVALARMATPSGQPVVAISRLLTTDFPATPRRIMAFSASSYCLLLHGCDWTGGPELFAEPMDLRTRLEFERVEVVVVDAAMRTAALELGKTDLSRFEEKPADFGFKPVGEFTGGVAAAYFRESGLDTASRLYVKGID